MTAPALPSFVDGTIVHQADLNSLVSNINVFAASVAGMTQSGQYVKPVCAVHLTSPLSIPTATETVIGWGAADINTNNMWTGSVPNQMTIQTAGTYFLSMSAIFASGLTTSTNSSEARIMVNGTTPSTNTVGCGTTSIYNNGWFVTCTAVAKLAVGATVFFAVDQTSGSTGSLVTTFGGTHAYAVYQSS